MRINDQLSVLFWLNKTKKTKDQLVPIYVRITVSGLRDGFASGKKIDPAYWNEKEGLANPSCPDYKAINNYIRKTTATLESIYERLDLLNERVTAGMMKEAYMPEPVITRTLMQAFELHNGQFKELVGKGLVSAGTMGRYERLERKVQVFLKKKYKRNDIELEDIQYSTASDFYHYLLLESIDKNTSMKYVKTLKQVIKKAVDQGWTTFNPIAGFKCSYEDPERDCLEMEEILSIYQKEIQIARLAEVRDAYVFACFTGYAYETLYNLEHENIFKGIDGKLWISKDRKKTGTKESVPLLPIALEIIDRYQSHPYCRETGKLLPINSNQRYNAYLKEVATICGITKHLTTHTARHTFATTVTLENDVPIETVSKMLGHKNIRTTQIYAKITKRKISNNMAALQNKLFDEQGGLRKVSNG